MPGTNLTVRRGTFPQGNQQLDCCQYVRLSCGVGSGRVPRESGFLGSRSAFPGSMGSGHGAAFPDPDHWFGGGVGARCDYPGHRRTLVERANLVGLGSRGASRK